MRVTPLMTAVARVLAGERLGAGRVVVAGLSGGADSVALLDALAALAPSRGFRVVAAHLDHGLREGSAADAAFCRRLCRRLGVPLRTARADVRARARREGCGLEEAARVERYAFLRRVKDEQDAVAIAVAHTLDDQAETFLLRLLRGSGRPGLACMRAHSGGLVRPLLGVSRAEVLAYLQTRGLVWREDPTNADTLLLRNRVRAELIPYLEARLNPAVRRVLARTAALLADEADLLAPLADELRERATIRRPGGMSLSREALAAAPRALSRLALRRALEEAGGLRGVSAVQIERLLELARSPAPSGRRLPLPGGREAVFHFDEVRIGPRQGVRPEGHAAEGFAVPLRVPGRVALPGGVTLEARTDPGPAGARDGAVVVRAPVGPLTVRTRRPGDRVRVGRRQVTLKRFLMDRRVPAGERGRLALLASGRQVLWVPGQQLSVGAGSRFVRIKLRTAARPTGRRERA